MASYLADKSALVRMPQPQVSARLVPLLRLREIAGCGINALEILYSTRSPADFDETRSELERTMPWVPTTDADLKRAIDVMGLLAHRGAHRDAGLPDLMLAAVAERNGLTVLHYDRDYEAIAAVTGQKVEWVVPQGSVP